MYAYLKLGFAKKNIKKTGLVIITIVKIDSAQKLCGIGSPSLLKSNEILLSLVVVLVVKVVMMVVLVWL